MLRFGRINYVNTLPIFEGLNHIDALDLPVEWVYGNPCQLARSFQKGELDLSFLSLLSYSSLKEHISHLGHFGIAAYPSAHSVCLYTRVPLWELHHKPVYLSPQSQSSIQLLKVLCKHFWNISPHFFVLQNDPLQEMDAYLLIGDQCLDHMAKSEYQKIDLAKAWCYATALPFTFSLLVYRKDLPQEKLKLIKPLTEGLNASYEWFLKNPHEVAQLASKDSVHTENFFLEYFTDLRYKLYEKELQSVDLFLHLLHQRKNQALYAPLSSTIS